MSSSNKITWFISIAVEIGVDDRRTEKVAILKFSISTFYTKNTAKTFFPIFRQSCPKSFLGFTLKGKDALRMRMVVREVPNNNIQTTDVVMMSCCSSKQISLTTELNIICTATFIDHHFHPQLIIIDVFIIVSRRGSFRVDFTLDDHYW